MSAYASSAMTRTIITASPSRSGPPLDGSGPVRWPLRARRNPCMPPSIPPRPLTAAMLAAPPTGDRFVARRGRACSVVLDQMADHAGPGRGSAGPVAAVVLGGQVDGL